MNGLALCAGIECFGLALRAVVPDYRTVCAVEKDPVAVAVLVARQGDGSLPPFPIWDDVETFDGRDWRGRIDIITAGFPCQPWSVAGRRRGTDDNRWLWPAIARIICEVEPRLVFLENVPGILSGGLGHVLGDLAEAGFAAEWGCFTATEVGAPHKRERVFLLADSNVQRQYESEIQTEQLGPPVQKAFAGRWMENGGLARGASGRVWPLPDPEVLGMAVRPASELERVRLRLLGNAIVPATAALAYMTLAGRLTSDR